MIYQWLVCQMAFKTQYKFNSVGEWIWTVFFLVKEKKQIIIKKIIYCVSDVASIILIMMSLCKLFVIKLVVTIIFFLNYFINHYINYKYFYNWWGELRFKSALPTIKLRNK